MKHKIHHYLIAMTTCLLSFISFAEPQSTAILPTGIPQTYYLHPNTPIKLMNSYSFDAKGKCIIVSQENENLILITGLTDKPVYINHIRLSYAESVLFTFLKDEEIQIEMTAKSKVELLNQGTHKISAQCELTM